MGCPSRQPAGRIWRAGIWLVYHRGQQPLPQIQLTRAFGGPDSSTRRSIATRPRARAMTSFAEGRAREGDMSGARPENSAELYRLLVASVRDYAIFALD